MIIAVYFVRTAGKISRRRFVEYLENEGFVCEVDEITDNAKVLNSRFPIIINATDKKYTILHTVTSSAAAAASDLLISEEEFYVLYKKGNCNYKEYLSAIRQVLLRYGYTDREIAEYFARPDIERIIKGFFADYKIGFEDSTPKAAATCLDLEFE